MLELTLQFLRCIKTEQNNIVNKNMICELEKLKSRSKIGNTNFKIFYDNCPEANDEFKALYESIYV